MTAEGDFFALVDQLLDDAPVVRSDLPALRRRIEAAVARARREGLVVEAQARI